MRVSSATAAPSRGTFRSARRRTRSPSTSMSRHGALADAVSYHVSTPARRTTSIVARPRCPAIVAAGSAPSRRIRGGVTLQSTTLESRPWDVGPSSMAAAQRSPREASARAQVVGLGSPWRLALDAATGAPSCASTAWSVAAGGMRTPTVAPPARAGLDQPSATGVMMVQGPGPRASMSVVAAGLRRGVRGEGVQIVGEEELQGLARALALGLVERAHGLVAADVGGDAVDGISREDGKSAGAQCIHGAGDRLRGRYRSGRGGPYRPWATRWLRAHRSVRRSERETLDAHEEFGGFDELVVRCVRNQAERLEGSPPPTGTCLHHRRLPVRFSPCRRR